MVTTETHQTQDLLVPTQNEDLHDQQDLQGQQDEDQAPSSLPQGEFDPEKISQGPVNAITVLTLLDKLVNMLDTVQENQHKMEVSQGWGVQHKVQYRLELKKGQTLQLRLYFKKMNMSTKTLQTKLHLLIYKHVLSIQIFILNE